MKNKLLTIVLGLVVLQAVFSDGVSAQALTPDTVTTSLAEVVSVLSEQQRNIPGTEVSASYQSLDVRILDGEEKGKVVRVENDYLNLKAGDKFYLRHTVNELDGINTYSVSDPYRLPTVYFFIGLFVLVVFIFGGKQGIRGLLALVLSFAFIIYMLLPGILEGYSPVLLSVIVSSIIIVLGSYITHGFNKVTTSAVVGMIVTIVITGALAYAAISFGKLTGFSDEESVYLNMYTRGAIDFAGLLLGAILIGLLGVLYDAAIGQAVSVDELHNVGPHLSRKYIFKRALRIGREHIGALVNTLAIAYVGVSLPLLLLFYNSSSDTFLNINREVFATEILRMMIGSIGLVLAVPITTAIAVLILIKRENHLKSIDSVDLEKEKVEKMSHFHSH